MSLLVRAFGLSIRFSAALSLAGFGCARSASPTSPADLQPGVGALEPATAAPAGTAGALPVEAARMNATALQLYMAGSAAFQAGDLPAARQSFLSATQADGSAHQAYYSLGVVRERLAETSGALEAYQRAASLAPDYGPAIVAYGVLLARSGKSEEADVYLTKQRAALPKSAAVAAALAEVKSLRGESGAAQRFAQEALKLDPDYRPAMVTLARDHYRARRLDLALYALKGILDGYGEENPPRDKTNAEARLIRGLIYREQGLRGPAMQELATALELRPDLVQARLHLAAYYLEAGNAEEAAKLLSTALRYDQQNILAHLNLGDAYRLLGKPAEAQRELEWVLSKDASMAQAHYNLGLLFLFSESVPGFSPAQATDRAIAEFDLYKKARPRKAGGAPDDTDELITRAKTKKALLEVKAADTAATPAAPGPPKPAGKPGNSP